jgi:exopolyphosphatase / guanosine-5'-triphosphate,3'-diphosphate pyrophosphatase
VTSVRCACIDIGSNTTRLLVAEPGAGGRLREVAQAREFTRIGAEVAACGGIGPEKAREVAAVAAAQAEYARTLGAERIEVVCTAAIRDAGHDSGLVELLDAAGVQVRVLSGEDEARLAFGGAMATLDRDEIGPAIPVAVADVGGGSTELAVGTVGGGVEWWVSLRVGSASLAREFLHSDPPTIPELALLRAHAAGALDAVDPPPVGLALAVGGSAGATATLVGPSLTPEACERAIATLLDAPVGQIALSNGLAPERVRLLPAGIVLLEEVGTRLGQPLRFARGGIREGVLLELLGSA